MGTTPDNSTPSLAGALKLHQSGMHDAAQKAYEALLAAEPDNADAENLLGVLHAQRGRLDDAMTRFARATELAPGNAMSWFNRGECARRLGQIENAVDWYRAALRIQPDYSDAFSNLSALLALSDRHDALLQLVREGLDANPDVFDHLIEVGQELLASRATDTAAELFALLDARQPSNRIVARNLSATLLRQGRMDEALARLQILVESHPDWPDATHMLGVCLEALDQLEPAIAAFEHTRARAPERIDTALALVRLHERRRDPASARAVLDKMLEDNPKEPRAWARLGQHLERTSLLQGANDAALAALQLNARDPVALTTLVQVAAREKNYDLARSRIRESRDIVSGTPAEIRFSYAAGRVYEALEEFEGALDFYRHANNLVRDLPRARWVRSKEFLANLQASRLAFETSAESIPASAASENAAAPTHPRSPVFVVGFPRSGTTLLERLLGTSPGVRITDELPTMLPVMNRFREITNSPHLAPAALDRLSAENIHELRSIYWARVSALLPETPEPDTALIDKNPMNLVQLPLIARMFPESRFLVLLRDPRDVCFSCFTTEFVINRTTHHFTDMQDTVALYEAVFGIWDAIEPALGEQAMTINYESLARNADALLPEILGFCGLEAAVSAPGGKPANLPAAEAGAWVNTASYNSVTEPVHQRAIARWKHFEPYFAAEFAALASRVSGKSAIE